jgi:quercetin dioxygenase-like cupin family protein
MRHHKLKDMVKGWFVGGFTPSVYATQDVEVAVKTYEAGAKEAWHFHKIATEITVIVSGEVSFNGQRFVKGDIVTVEPNEGMEFHALTDTTTVVVKIPGALGDKYTEST